MPVRIAAITAIFNNSVALLVNALFNVCDEEEDSDFSSVGPGRLPLLVSVAVPAEGNWPY